MTTADFLARARATRMLVVGDVMTDAYLWGRVDRISPEAPVPVVQVTDRSARLGGAANVALNAHAFGATAIVAAVVGDDDAARTLFGLFDQHQLPVHGLVRSAARRTTVKTRIIAGHQHIVRVDEEQEDPIAPPDEDQLLEVVDTIIERDKPGVIVLEDYDKGVLTPRTIAVIIARAAAAGIPVAVDPKKRNFTAYRGVDLFKPNLKELREGLKTEVVPGETHSLRKAAAALKQTLDNKATLLTLGEHGVYATDGAEEHRVPAHHRSIADVSGAGDTVITVAALAMAQGMGLGPLARMANLAGGLVCEHVGVVPIDAARFQAECERLGVLA